MKKITTVTIDEHIIEAVRNKHINVSSLVESLLLGWLEAKKGKEEELKEKIKELDNNIVCLQSEQHLLQKQLSEILEQKRKAKLLKNYEEATKWDI